jgi:hypothetical protein
MPRQIMSDRSFSFGQTFHEPAIDTFTGPFAGVVSGSSSSYKMRCPTCQKLYSVQSEQIENATAALKFQCVSCQEPFQARLAHNGGVGFVEVSILGATDSISQSPRARSETQTVLEKSIEKRTEKPSAEGPLRARQTVEKVPLAVSELRCPKCGSRNVLSATDCRFCGVVFSKVKLNSDIESDPGLAAHPQLIQLWEAALSNYEEPSRHEAFIKACAEAEYLQFAGLKYSKLLAITPHDETARVMKTRVIALASLKTVQAQVKSPKPFRIPSINNIMLGSGGGLMMMGMILPTVRNLAGVGFAALILAIGVRFFMRPEI